MVSVYWIDYVQGICVVLSSLCWLCRRCVGVPQVELLIVFQYENAGAYWENSRYILKRIAELRMWFLIVGLWPWCIINILDYSYSYFLAASYGAQKHSRSRVSKGLHLVMILLVYTVYAQKTGYDTSLLPQYIIAICTVARNELVVHTCVKLAHLTIKWYTYTIKFSMQVY